MQPTRIGEERLVMDRVALRGRLSGDSRRQRPQRRHRRDRGHGAGIGGVDIGVRTRRRRDRANLARLVDFRSFSRM